jgi:hypothetical protein
MAPESGRPPAHPMAAGGRSGSGRGRTTHVHAARPQPEAPHTAPHDELVSVVRRLVETSPRRSVSIDAVANALKSRGFQRPPGSPRLITRLRRIRELLVSSSGTITLAEDSTVPREEPVVESAPTQDLDSDRQPDYLGEPESEPGLPEVDGNLRLPEVDGNLKVPEVDGNRAHPPGHGRRRRRRRRRGGQHRPAPGPRTV